MIINGSEQYQQLKERMDREQYIKTPIHRDFYAHPSINPILCEGITFLNGDTYILSVSHNDAEQFPTITTPQEINGQVVAYINNHSIPNIQDYYTPYIRNTIYMFPNLTNGHHIIPLATWSTVLKEYNTRLLNITQQFPNSITTTPYQFICAAVTVLRTIESAGLSVDMNLLVEHFGKDATRYVKDNLIYSQYNPFTTTGRPSNRYGGINFAALNKTDGSRQSFVSRFEGGTLIQVDFEAYHLRLLGKHGGLDLPSTSLHEYLARQYYEKDDITPEEYELAKQQTFSVLYGADVDTDVPLLKTLRNLSTTIYEEYQRTGVLTTPIAHREIKDDDLTENKVFNYFVQALEFEHTVPRLERLVDALRDKQSKIVLYTYDAVLMDCPPDEVENTIEVARDILGADGYPVRTYRGNNYDQLIVF